MVAMKALSRCPTRINIDFNSARDNCALNTIVQTVVDVLRHWLCALCCLTVHITADSADHCVAFFSQDPGNSLLMA